MTVSGPVRRGFRPNPGVPAENRKQRSAREGTPDQPDSRVTKGSPPDGTGSLSRDCRIRKRRSLTESWSGPSKIVLTFPGDGRAAAAGPLNRLSPRGRSRLGPTESACLRETAMPEPSKRCRQDLARGHLFIYGACFGAKNHVQPIVERSGNT